MNLIIRIALKYLAGKNSYFLSFSNLIAFLGIVIGLFSLIIVSAVMNGLSRDMAERIISTKGEIRLFNSDFSSMAEYAQFIDELQQRFPQISTAGPVNQGEFLLRRRSQTLYTENYGIDFTKHNEISNVFNKMRIGVPTEENFKDNGIVLGIEISFNLNATVGDTIDVVSPSILVPTPIGLVPRTERYKVVGVFQTGFPEFDRLYSFIDIDKSKNFKRQTGVDFIELKTTQNNKNFNKLTQQIESEFPHITAQHWEIFDKTLFQAIQIEKIAMFIVMAIILVLASFNITGNFIRTVTEKKEEIAILKTLGMDRKNIFCFFVVMGMLICATGIVVAVGLALSLLQLQQRYEFIQVPIPGFPFSAVPVDLNLLQIAWFSILTFAICTFGTIYPAYKTIKINIIEVLHEGQHN